MVDVTESGFGFPNPFGPTRRNRPRARPRAQRLSLRQLPQAIQRMGPAAARIGWIGAAGYAAYQLERKIIEHYEKAQDQAFTLMMQRQDALANAAARRILAQKVVDKKRLELEVARARYNAQIYGGAPPGPPAPWLIPGATRVHPGMEPYIQVPNRPLPAAAPGGVGVGTIPSPVSIPPAPVPTQKEALAKRAWAFLQTGLGITLTGGVIAAAVQARAGGSVAPEPFFEAPPLTGFQPEPVFSGSLGGQPEFDQSLEEEPVDEECENVQPRRAPGECRQGWFEESPSELRLREWSRRPCL